MHLYLWSLLCLLHGYSHLARITDILHHQVSPLVSEHYTRLHITQVGGTREKAHILIID